jgi:LacI family transcriptional regulator
MFSLVTTRRATITDVADLADVSVATASKPLDSLDSHVNAREATGQPIPEAAARRGFPPNALAQGPPSGQTRSVGPLTADLAGRFGIPCRSVRKRFRDS